MENNQGNISEKLQHSFSLDQLNKVGNNDLGFTIQMTRQFLSTAIDCSENMLLALSQESWTKLKNTAHKSVPSYSVMGLPDLVQRLKEIEMLSEGGIPISSIEELVMAFEAKNKKLIRELEEYLQAT